MNDDQYAPEELSVIQQLRAEQKPRIKLEVEAAIREQMLAEFRTLSQQPQPTTNASPIRFILAVAASVVLVILALLSQRTKPIDSTLSVSATSIALAASGTPTYTPTSITTTPITATSPTMTVDSIATPTLQVLVVIEGPISAITNDSLTIYDLNIPVMPEHPIRSLIEVGDFVHVEGTYDASGAFIAAVIGNLPEFTRVSSADATVGLEGMVESIDDNILVVNNVTVQLDLDDPLLQTVQVGDFVSVEGNFHVNADAIVLMVVTITVRADVNEIQSNCWYHEAMGMGHWHCDGMGMGGMGMGDDGMGMGS